MRGLAVAILVLLAMPALSGCISVNELIGLPAPPAEVEQASEWLPLPGSLVAPAEGAVGFRVGADAPALRFLPALSPVDGVRPGPEQIAPLTFFDMHLIVYGPDGGILYSGDPTPDDNATPSAEQRSSSASLVMVKQPRTHDEPFLTLISPAAGSYTMVIYGELGTPRVETYTPADGQMPQLVPLRLVQSRVVVQGKPSPLAATFLGGEGELEPPANLAFAWMRPVGEVFDLNLTLSTDRGIVSSMTVLADASPAGLTTDNVFFSRAPLFYGDVIADPAMIDEDPLHWSIRGTGVGAVVAHFLSVARVPEAPDRRADGPRQGNEEFTPLSGSVSMGDAAWLSMPRDSRLRLAAEDPGAEVRIYDRNGTLLAGLSLSHRSDEDAELSLPAGIIVVVNDGRGTVTAELVGASPADASLHAVGIIEHMVVLRNVEAQGEASARVSFTAPAVGWRTDTRAPLTGVQINLEELHEGGGLVAAWPHMFGRAGSAPCCGPSPWLAPYAMPTWMLHGGVYRLTGQAFEGMGDIEVTFFLLDLDGLQPGAAD